MEDIKYNNLLLEYEGGCDGQIIGFADESSNIMSALLEKHKNPIRFVINQLASEIIFIQAIRDRSTLFRFPNKELNSDFYFKDVKVCIDCALP